MASKRKQETKVQVPAPISRFGLNLGIWGGNEDLIKEAQAIWKDRRFARMMDCLRNHAPFTTPKDVVISPDRLLGRLEGHQYAVNLLEQMATFPVTPQEDAVLESWGAPEPESGDNQ